MPQAAVIRSWVMYANELGLRYCTPRLRRIGDLYVGTWPGLDSLRRRIDLKNVFLIGHSFGGATCLEVRTGFNIVTTTEGTRASMYTLRLLRPISRQGQVG